MPPEPTHATARLPRLAHRRARPRLVLSVLAGVIVALALAVSSRAERFLIGWDVGVALYLIAAYQLIVTGSERTMRRSAAVEDEGRFGVLVLTVGAALASLAAIVILLTEHAMPAARAA